MASAGTPIRDSSPAISAASAGFVVASFMEGVLGRGRRSRPGKLVGRLSASRRRASSDVFC
jgi:hypothetical protein